MKTIVLLVVSNIFMTFAWYGHLKDKGMPLWKAILISWGIAFLNIASWYPPIDLVPWTVGMAFN